MSSRIWNGCGLQEINPSSSHRHLTTGKYEQMTIILNPTLQTQPLKNPNWLYLNDLLYAPVVIDSGIPEANIVNILQTFLYQ